LGGEAVADIVFGDVVPSGKLPITFPASTEQLPPYEDYSMRGRTYRYMTEKPLYPFGFGLSYTSFRFEGISLSAQNLCAGGSLDVEVSIANTGQRDAEDVVQLYIAREDRGPDEPICSLRAFRRIWVAAGTSRRLNFSLTAAGFESVNAQGERVLLPGRYRISAADAAPLPVSVERGAPAPVSAVITVAGH
jgi:beta-glucosidase